MKRASREKERAEGKEEREDKKEGRWCDEGGGRASKDQEAWGCREGGKKRMGQAMNRMSG
jgi:hypothetical protein